MASTNSAFSRKNVIGDQKTGLNSKNSRLNDDNFYSDLAADLEELSPQESDVSEADVSKMLADMDDMDDALFGSSLKPRPSGGSTSIDQSQAKKVTSRVDDDKSDQTAKLEKTLEDELAKAMQATSPVSSPRRTIGRTQSQQKTFDFGDFDEDDPLAGLLSDDDDEPLVKTKPSKPSPSQHRPPASQQHQPPGSQQHQPAASQHQPAASQHQPPASQHQPPASQQQPVPEANDSHNPDDRKEMFTSKKKDLPEPEDVKPTSRSTAGRPGRAPSDGADPDSYFGDESDLLGSLGLGTSPREKRRSQLGSEAEQAREKVNELFGSSPASRMLDKPPAGKKQSQLDKILQKKEPSGPKPAAKEEEEFSFGSYTPSSVQPRPGSAPPPRRSVRFSDENDPTLDMPRSRTDGSFFHDKPIDRPRSAAAGTVTSRRAASASSTEVPPPTSDWLALAAGPKDSGPRSGDPKSDKIITAMPDAVTDGSPSPLDSPTKTTKRDEMSPTSRPPSAGDYLGLSDGDVDLDSLVGLSHSKTKPDPPQDGTVPFDPTLDDLPAASSRRSTVSPFPWSSSNDGQYGPLDRPPTSSTPLLPTDQDEIDSRPVNHMDRQLQQEQNQQQQQQQPNPQEQASSKQSQPIASPQKPRPAGARKESQWRQELRQKQQQQQQQQQDNDRHSGVSGGITPNLSNYEQQRQTKTATDPTQPLSSTATTTSSSLPGYVPSDNQQPTAGGNHGANWLDQLDRNRRAMDQILENQQAQWATHQQSLQQQQLQQQAMQEQLQVQESMLRTRTGAAASPGVPGFNGSQLLAGPLLPGLATYGLEAKIHQLESKKCQLEAEIQTLQESHSRQMAVMQKTHKDYTQLLEDSASRREARFHDEHQGALQQYEQRLKHLQEDHTTQMEQVQQRMRKAHAENDSQHQQLQRTHRLAMDTVNRQHEEQLQQVTVTMQNEVEALNQTQTHSRSLQDVVHQVESASKELGSLQSQVRGQQQSQLDQRSVILAEKDHQLQALEKRLSEKEEEMSGERSRLEGLVHRLEAHIRQQNNQLDEERFRLRQEQNKLNSVQKGIEDERKLAAEQLASQHASLQQAKDAVLDEQKTILSQCLEERKALATERAQVAATRRQLEISLQEQTSKVMQSGAEHDSKVEMLAAERSQLAARRATLQHEEQSLQQERLQLSQHRQELDAEQGRLQQLAETLRQRSGQIQQTVLEGVRAREEGQCALQAAGKIEAEQDTRERNIENQLQSLRATQRQLVQERVDLATEQNNLKKLRGSLRCRLCSGSVSVARTNGVAASRQVWLANDDTPRRSTPHHQHHEMDRTPSRALSQKGAADRLLSEAQLGQSLTMWKMAADKDKDFLEEESVFLETLKSPSLAKHMQQV